MRPIAASLVAPYARLITALVIITTCNIALARDLPTSNAKREGFSEARLDRLNDLAERYVSEGRVAGITTVVARHGKIVHFESRGQRGIEDKRPLTDDALFRIFSMTKPVTAVAAMQLYEQGHFRLQDPITKFLPELANLEVLQDDGSRVPAATPITMHQLLTHTAGFSYGFNPGDPVDQLYRKARGFELANLDEFVQSVAKLPLKYQPGTRWHYSIAVDLTGLIIERISGQPLDEYFAEHIFAPLEMQDTFFAVPDDKLERFLPNHRWNRAEQKLAPVGDEFISRFRNTTLFSGGGGLVSTAMDYLRFCEMLRGGGVLDGQRVLGRKTVQFMTQNHLAGSLTALGSGEQPIAVGSNRSRFGFGLGFGVNVGVPESGVIGSLGEYSWGGAAGTVFWIDPEEDLIVIAMIQLMQSPWPLRHDLKVAVYQALEDS